MTMWCHLLVEEGILKQVEDGWEVVRIPEQVDPEKLFGKATGQYPGAFADLSLIARCGRQLPEILTGQADPLTILFAEEAFAAMEHHYESGLRNRRSNRLLQ